MVLVEEGYALSSAARLDLLNLDGSDASRNRNSHSSRVRALDNQRASSFNHDGTGDDLAAGISSRSSTRSRHDFKSACAVVEAVFSVIGGLHSVVGLG